MPSNDRASSLQDAYPETIAHQLQALPTAYFFAPDLEREINRLESVASVKVLSTGSEIDEIHVVAPLDRSPKKIVRDIESLLLVRFGIRIDHRRISIVQMDHLPVSAPQYIRPQITNISQDKTCVRVEFAIGAQLLIGQSQVRPGENEAIGTARAVLHAVEQLLQTPGVLSVLKTHIAEMDEYRTMLVLVRWIFADQQELLLGASIVHSNLLECAARATLDAVNRRLVRIHTASN